MAFNLEDGIPGVKYGGLNTNTNVDFSGSNSVALPGATTIGGSSVVALASITSSSTSANAFSVTNTGVFVGASVQSIVANNATTGTITLETANGLTIGHLHSMTSSGTITTTGDMLSIVANSATTSTGLVRISGTGLTDGFALAITGGGANATALGGGINLSLGAATLGTGIAIATTGIYLGTTGLFSITANSMTTGTGALITSSGVMTTTGNLLTLTGNAATTAAGLLRINANGLTSGIGLAIASSATAITGAGRLVYVNHTGVTGTSAILNEFATSATDETDLFKLTTASAGTSAQGAGLWVASSGATAAGAAVAYITATGTPLSTGYALAIDNSGITAANNPAAVFISQVGTGAAIKTTTAAQSTHFYKIMTDTASGVTLWMSDGTTGQANLSGTAGDLLFNGGSHKPEYCTGTTNWTALV